MQVLIMDMKESLPKEPSKPSNIDKKEGYKIEKYKKELG